MAHLRRRRLVLSPGLADQPAHIAFAFLTVDAMRRQKHRRGEKGEQPALVPAQPYVLLDNALRHRLNLAGVAGAPPCAERRSSAVCGRLTLSPGSSPRPGSGS